MYIARITRYPFEPEKRELENNVGRIPIRVRFAGCPARVEYSSNLLQVDRYSSIGVGGGYTDKHARTQ